jgi:hypothetical protein
MCTCGMHWYSGLAPFAGMGKTRGKGRKAAVPSASRRTTRATRAPRKFHPDEVPAAGRSSNPFTGKQPLRLQPGGSTGPKEKSNFRGLCFKFDQNGACDFAGCRFKHMCSKCGKQGHAKQSCRLVTADTGSNDDTSG